MKKRTIVIASILKPVDDTRMFEKMASTLAAQEGNEVFLIGLASRSIPVNAHIHFMPLASFRRISLKRMLAPLGVFARVYKVKPDILIVNTHEILIVAALIRIIFGTRIVYDIRENYFRNILYSEAFPRLIRPLLAAWVRLKEILLAPAFHHFFLAEAGYQKEMSFFKDRATVIQNKAITAAGRLRKTIDGRRQLLFSGTLAETTGVFEAIGLARKLHAIDNSVRLLIIGHCSKAALLKRMIEEIRDLPFIELKGGNTLIPHREIADAIYASDFGIICYPPSRHTENAIPTKLYEYLAAQLPILLQDHPPWVDLALPFQACFPLDFTTFDAATVLGGMAHPYYTAAPPTGVTWESEAGAFLEVLQKI